MSTHSIQLSVNGRIRQLEIDSSELLVEVLRNRCGLTGTHVGCDTSQCGACTVLVDGLAIKSCNTLALQQAQRSVVTIESDPLVLQESFSRHHALQCGYCTPGMIMRALALVDEQVALTPQAVADALEGNMCRCTGYTSIIAAVIDGVGQLRARKATLASEQARQAAIA
jgi:aerobic carbon-monoxide dehydrogenase small subunit